jgi:hypothetical protein
MSITVNNNQSTIYNQNFHTVENENSTARRENAFIVHLQNIEKIVLSNMEDGVAQHRENLRHIAELKHEVTKPKPDSSAIERSLSALGSIGTLVSAVQPLRDLLKLI